MRSGRKTIGEMRDELLQERYYVSWLRQAMAECNRELPEWRVADRELRACLHRCVVLLAGIKAREAQLEAETLPMDEYWSGNKERSVQGSDN